MQKLYNEEAEVLKHQIEEGSISNINEAEDKIIDEELKYRERKGRKWITLILGAAIGGVAGYFLMPKIYQLTKSSYDRSGIEKICDEMFGNVMLKEALTKEVNIVSYEYNRQQPRIFSKATARIDASTFDVSISDASEASSAAPIYFDPKVIGDQVLIDGGVIANNPAMYSYLHSKHANKQGKISILSIGTGDTKHKEFNSDTTSKVDWLFELGTLISTVEANAHNYLLK